MVTVRPTDRLDKHSLQDAPVSFSGTPHNKNKKIKMITCGNCYISLLNNMGVDFHISSNRYSIFMEGMRNVTTGYCGNDLAKENLADNEWHQVQIQQREKDGMTLTLYVDISTTLIIVPGFYSRRFAHQTFYLGGVDSGRMQTRHWHLRKRTFVPFEGCFENKNVKINGLTLLDLAWKGNANVSGKLDSKCNIAPGGYHPITFLKPESFIKVIAPNNSTASYSFKFRTYNAEGILLFQRITKDNGANIFISLVSGRIKLEAEFMSKSTPVTLRGGSVLNDGMWHSVVANISIQKVRLQVDNELTSQSQRSQGRFVSSSEVFVGASGKGRRGFVGCMRDLTVQGLKINFTTVKPNYKSQVEVGKCSLLDRCVQNPCKNGGRCSQRWNRTICDCAGTDFKGPKCETPSFFMQSCADWWTDGKRSNTYYKINPRHSEPFSVYCNMTNVKGPSTVIFHTQDRKQVIAAQNKVDGKSYHHQIFYENSKDKNIRDLIASSTHCRQYLRYNCYNSVLFDSPKTFNLESGRGARWVSRDGQLQDYWSGAFRGSMKCACGVNRTCVESNKACNCDTVDNKWHMDDGYLTDSGSLPVKKLVFSVDGTSPRSYYVLGSLECYGSTTKRTTPKTVTTDFPLTETVTTPKPTASKSTKHETKSPSTIYTTARSGKSHVSSIDSTLVSAPPSTLSTRNDVSSKEPHGTPETKTQATQTPSDQPDIVVIESPRKYITIRENANQQLVLIILSVILAVFVIAIVVLIVKQNLFFPCKCFQALQAYRDVRHMDTIELGPPSPAEPEILQFEASPYPARNNYDMGIHDCRISSSPELYSDAETDRLDFSNGSSSWNSENADIEKEKPQKQSDYEDVDLGLIDVVPFSGPKQLSTEQQIMKLKEVIYDVLTAADVTATYSDKNENTTSPIKHYKDSTYCKAEVQQSLLTENEQLVDSDSDSTATISELSSEIELFSGEQSSKNYSCGKETGSEEAYNDSPKENSLKSCNPERRNGIDKENWRSSDPHDNYLSLDVNNVEEGTLRQPLRGTNLNGRSRYNEQMPCDNNLSYPQTERVRFLPATCDGKRRETKPLKEDKRKHSSPRPRLFSRQKSEEEALLSSSQVNGLKQNRTNRFSDNYQRRYSGIANAFCQQKQQPQQQQYPNANENQSDTQFRDRNSTSATARAMPQKQPHPQKYETEL